MQERTTPVDAEPSLRELRGLNRMPSGRCVLSAMALLVACASRDEHVATARGGVDIAAFVTLDAHNAWMKDEPTPIAPDVAASVRTTSAAARTCYAAGLARDASLRGWLTVELSVDARGAVTQTALVTCRHADFCTNDCDAMRADPPFADGAVAACIVQTLRGVTFPPRAATFVLPFRLDDHAAAEPAFETGSAPKCM